MKTALKAFVFGCALLLVGLSGCGQQEAEKGVEQDSKKGVEPDILKGLEAYERRDYAAALLLWRPLAEKGNALAQYNLGVMYNRPSAGGEYEKAVKWYRLAAEQGLLVAQFDLGEMYRTGLGVARDYEEAVKWYRLAAEQGASAAQYWLGALYADGKGVIQNNVYAHMWLNIVAKTGDAAAIKNRDMVRARMTEEDLSKAQDLASECVKKNYKGCGEQEAERGVERDSKKGVEPDILKGLEAGLEAHKKKDYAAAMREWGPLAERGDASAQNYLGQMYYEGLGVPQDYKEAMRFYQLASEQGNASAQYNLGQMLYEGKGAPQSYPAALKWHQLSAEQGNANAQFNVGWMYHKGQGVTQDDVYAYMWINIAALKDEAVVQRNGDIFTNVNRARGVSDAVRTRFTLSQELNTRDLSKAQNLSSECVKKNYKRCGEAFDYVVALREFEPLAENGDAKAQSSLGSMYENGQGVMQDYKEAVRLFGLAAAQGDATGQDRLGHMYSEGLGVTQNTEEALRLYKLAAAQGHAIAQTKLGLIYAKGLLGVAQDDVYAYMWLNIAVSSGAADMAGSRDIVARKMTAAQVEKAQELVRECVKKNYKGC